LSETSTISKSQIVHFKPSIWRWLIGTLVAVVSAPVPLILLGFAKDFHDVKFIKIIEGIYKAFAMGVIVSPIALIYVFPCVLLAYVLYKLFNINNLLYYILIGLFLPTLLIWPAIQEKMQYDIRTLLIGGFFGVPGAVIFWLIVWWPLVGRRWTSSQDESHDPPVSEAVPVSKHRRLVLGLETDKDSSQNTTGQQKPPTNSIGESRDGMEY